MKGFKSALTLDEQALIADVMGTQRAHAIMRLIDEIVSQQEESVIRMHLSSETHEKELLYKKLRAEGAKSVASFVRAALTPSPKA